MYKRYYVRRKTRKTPTYQMRHKEHDFLKYWRIVRYYITRQYDISYPELELLLYLYDEGVFTKTDFKEFEECMSWRKGRFEELMDKGLIRKWRDRKGAGHANLYELTQKARLICNQAYKKLTQEEAISEDKYRNEVFRSNNYMDKIYRRLIKKMNEKKTSPDEDASD
jgi:uncharacterized protein YqgQ